MKYTRLAVLLCVLLAAHAMDQQPTTESMTEGAVPEQPVAEEQVMDSTAVEATDASAAAPAEETATLPTDAEADAEISKVMSELEGIPEDAPKDTRKTKLETAIQSEFTKLTEVKAKANYLKKYLMMMQRRIDDMVHKYRTLQDKYRAAEVSIKSNEGRLAILTKNRRAIDYQDRKVGLVLEKELAQNDQSTIGDRDAHLSQAITALDSGLSTNTMLPIDDIDRALSSVPMGGASAVKSPTPASTIPTSTTTPVAAAATPVA